MGLSVLKGTDVHEFVRTCIPRETEVRTISVFDEYEIKTLPRYMDTLGTMCDYGVRSYFPIREYAYIEIGLAMGEPNPIIEAILEDERISAQDAYALCSFGQSRKPGKLGAALIQDYDRLTERAISLYRCLYLVNPCFGKYYLVDGVVKSFECDCVDSRSVLDMKISRTCEHNRDYWCQLLYYSLLSKLRDGQTRTHMCLIYPVQGVIKEFTYSRDVYFGMYKRFVELYSKEGL